MTQHTEKKKNKNFKIIEEQYHKIEIGLWAKFSLGNEDANFGLVDPHWCSVTVKHLCEEEKNKLPLKRQENY